MLAADAVGHEITTVEGLGTPETMSPVQAAFVECDALQCGFCTPGFVVAVHGAPGARTRSPTLDEIKAGLAGNLCRCGTYGRIFEAVQRPRRMAKPAPAQELAMPQEAEAASRPPTVHGEGRPLPARRKPLEVHAADGDLKPWDLDSRSFERVGKAAPAPRGPLKVTGPREVHVRRQAPGHALGPDGRRLVPAREIVEIDTSKAEALPG